MGNQFERPLKDLVGSGALEGKSGLEISFMLGDKQKKEIEAIIGEKSGKKKKEEEEEEKEPEPSPQVSLLRTEPFYTGIELCREYLLEKCCETKVTFRDVLNFTGRHCYVTGEAGNGKSVLLRQLFKASCQQKISMYVKLNELTEEKYSLQSFMKAGFAELFKVGKDEGLQVYQCIQGHQFDCQIFLDGLDEVEWSLTDQYLDIRGDEEVHISQLVTNLLHKERRGEMGNMKLCVAGRPQVIRDLPVELRSDVVFHVDGLVQEDQEIVFNHLAKFSKYHQIPPNIMKQLYNPFNLQMAALWSNHRRSKINPNVTMAIMITSACCFMVKMAEDEEKGLNIADRSEIIIKAVDHPPVN